MADLSITPASVVPTAGCNIEHGTAGVAIDAGEVIYVAAGLAQLADCTTAAKAGVRGIAVCSADAGQPISWATSGIVTTGATSAGVGLWVSDNAGKLGPISDRGTTDYLSLVGIGYNENPPYGISLHLYASAIAIP